MCKLNYFILYSKYIFYSFLLFPSYLDTSNVTPLIFVLSSGSDPMANFLRFAEDMKYMDKFYSISLGQGQGPVAANLIDKSLRLGHWVFLQNCHLATSWMPQMENIVRNISLGVIKAHEDFRLFLSSMPQKKFSYKCVTKFS